jgi:ribosomal protein S7
MKKQYVYIGRYYHIKNKELPLDYKFGVTENLDQREFSLSRTKSPIKYMILKAWEIPINVKREKVEKLISTVFAENKYDGCEWYDIDGDMFQGKISILFQIISDMIEDGNFNFQEVDLDSSSKTEDVVEKEIEKEIRSGKKSEWTNLKITFDGEEIIQEKAKDSLIQFVKKVLERVEPVQFAIDFPRLLKANREDFPIYKKNQSQSIGDFWLDTHSSTSEKKRMCLEILDFYGFSGGVEII